MFPFQYWVVWVVGPWVGNEVNVFISSKNGFFSVGSSFACSLHFRPMVPIIKRIVLRLSFEPTSMAIFEKFGQNAVLWRHKNGFFRKNFYWLIMFSIQYRTDWGVTTWVGNEVNVFNSSKNGFFSVGSSFACSLHFRPMVPIIKRIVLRLSFEPTSMAIFWKFPFDDVIRRLYDVIEAEFYEKILLAQNVLCPISSWFVKGTMCRKWT